MRGDPPEVSSDYRKPAPLFLLSVTPLNSPEGGVLAPSTNMKERIMDAGTAFWLGAWAFAITYLLVKSGVIV